MEGETLTAGICSIFVWLAQFCENDSSALLLEFSSLFCSTLLKPPKGGIICVMRKTCVKIFSDMDSWSTLTSLPASLSTGLGYE